jgi:hypothetical protein
MVLGGRVVDNGRLQTTHFEIDFAAVSGHPALC